MTDQPLIDISPENWLIVRDILQRHVPDREVWAFGSRAKWTAKEYSDLDIAIISAEPLSLGVMAELNEAFQESALPFKVDVVDWAGMTPSFRKVIETSKVQLLEAGGNRHRWPMVRLGDYCVKIGSGATPKGAKEAYFESGPYSLIRSQNIYNDGFSWEGLAFISHEQAKKLDGVAVHAGDVLLNITGDSVARVCSAPEKVIPARVNQRVAIIRPNSSSFDPRFIRYFLATPKQQNLLLGMASAGATRHALTKGMIEDLRIPKPSMPEQAEIADVLSSLDDKILSLRETNASLEAIAQTLFKSWFIDFDPVRAKAEGRKPDGVPPEIAELFPSEFEDSEIGEIPRGWRIGKLGEVSKNVRIGAKPDELRYDTPYIGLEHIPRQSISLDSWGDVTGLESGKFRFTKGQILFGKLRPYFHKVGIAPVDGVCSTDILVIESVNDKWLAFCVSHYSSKELIEHATQLSNGARMPRSIWKDVSEFRVAMPPESIASVFNEVITPIYQRIVANVHSMKTVGATRDALLPRLMSGLLSPDNSTEQSSNTEGESNVI